MMMERDNPEGSQLTEEEWERIRQGRDGGGGSSKEGSDGLLSRMSPGHQGVLVRAMRAHKIEEMAQELKTAGFASSDECDEFVAAWNEAEVLGMDTTVLYYQFLGRSAGVKHSRLYEIFRTMTHQSRTVNYPKNYKPDKKEDAPL